jgi:hypothetical protein
MRGIVTPQAARRKRIHTIACPAPVMFPAHGLRMPARQAIMDAGCAFMIYKKPMQPSEPADGAQAGGRGRQHRRARNDKEKMATHGWTLRISAGSGNIELAGHCV